jgi:hypothetical protein
MVFGMTLYNMFILENGTQDVSMLQSTLQFMAVFCVALVIDWFVIAPLVKFLVSKMTSDQTPFIKKVIFISGLMVLFMCTVMSLLATLLHGYQASFWPAYANTFYLNLVFALPLQFLIVGPLVRTLFIKVFPTPITAAQA